MMRNHLLTRRQALGAAAAPILAQKAARPNIVFVLIDDLRWDALSCMGHPVSRTPAIDRIASEGAIFRNAFVTTPLCSPSRASFLTGRYVHSHTVRGNSDNNALSHQLVTFPRLLHDAGYETAYVGKWHMGNDDSPRPGFDRWVSFRGQGIYVDPPMNIDGKMVKRQGYMTDLLSDHAAEFIQQPHDKPFCLYLAHKAVHGPFTPAERHKDLYSSAALPHAPNTKSSLEGKVALRGRPDTNPNPELRGPNETLIRNQLRCLASIDDGIGKILKALEATGQLDNTFVVFTSDNGYFWGEHGLGDKRWAYEESIRIPMVARYPKLIRKGTKIEGLALNIDIAPTMLDLGGASLPRDMHGRSLLPLLKGGRSAWRSAFLAEYFQEAQFPRTPTWQAVRTDRWKYVRYEGMADADELYDLKSDPYEMKNRVGDPAARSTLESLKRELDKILQETT